MPQTTSKIENKLEQPGFLVRDREYYRRERLVWLGLALSGLLMGLSAPGIDQWYIAWFGLVPLLLAALTARNVPEAFYRGVHYGFAYTLVYDLSALEFTTDIYPEYLNNYLWLANPTVWVLVGLQQAALYGTFASVLRWLPLKPGFLPSLKEGNLRLPALLTIPIVWCLLFSKLGNVWGTLGLTWGLLEYSQHQRTQLIQIAEIIGGIGVGALLVVTNIALYQLITAIGKTKGFKFETFSASLKQALTGLVVVLGLIIACHIYGIQKLNNAALVAARAPHEMVTVLQGNVLFDATVKDTGKFFNTYLQLAKSAPSGICVWPEWAIPASVTLHPEVFSRLGYHAKTLNQDWIVGCLDGTSQDDMYNSACGIDRTGKLFKEVYHKRYLVPFGEYTPKWILNSPFGALCGTLTPHRIGYSPGNSQTVFSLSGKRISAILCCELASAELSAEATRNGAQLLVDCSNTSWFDSKLIGKQCIAICKFRAIENHRCFVFSTTLGPSAIINANGTVRAKTRINSENTVSRNLPFYSDLTPFTRWFR